MVLRVRIETTYRTRPKIGEVSNGDAAVVRVGPTHAMFAVIDALGHGPVAESIARKAAAAIEAAPLDQGTLALLEAVHEALKGSRGAALTLGLHRHGERSLEVAGVGNVSARGLGRSVAFVPTPGVLGARMSRPRPATIEMHEGEGVLLLSDGIPRRLDAATLTTRDPTTLCDRVLAMAHAHDDATVLLVQWR
jgi:negative regulator of sigma-B (phosphoserine phosphatase)